MNLVLIMLSLCVCGIFRWKCIVGLVYFSLKEWREILVGDVDWGIISIKVVDEVIRVD